MDLSMADLVEQSGAPARTIRHWISLGLLPRPKGNGPAAVYAREHLLRLWVITALREQNLPLESITEMLAGMSPREMGRYKPRAPPAEPPASPGEPAPAGAPRLGGAAGDDLAVARATTLPGRRYSLVPLLPGMVLMVDEDAAAVVKRAALEIVERYGAGSG